MCFMWKRRKDSAGPSLYRGEKRIDSDVSPVRCGAGPRDWLLPFRAVVEAEGYTVYYDRKNKTALALREGRPELFIDYETGEASIGSDPVTCPVVLRGGRILAAASFFETAFETSLRYDEEGGVLQL